VVALARGGALETVKNGHTGLLFPNRGVAAERGRRNLSPAAIRVSTPRFSRQQHAAQVAP
jgi:hypothetical protein